MQDALLSTFQATAPNSLLSVGLLLVSVLINVLVPAVNDGPSPSNCQPRLSLLSPPPTHTFQRLPTPTTIAPIPRDVVSTAMSVLWISCAVAVLTAASGIAGVQKVLYGGSPAAWPTPPSGRNPFSSPVQEGSEWVEDEEEEENDEDPAGDGPPPPPPDPPAKVEESPKLPRRRLPLWVIWLICITIIASTGVILIRHLAGVMSSTQRKKAAANDPDVITPEPRVPIPPQCPRPLLSLPRPPPPPPHSSPMCPALFRVVDILRRGNFPLLATLAQRSATSRPPVSLYRWVADLLYQIIWVFLSVGDSVQRAVLNLLRGWVMDMVAFCIIFSVWFGSDWAGTVVEDIIEEHTLVAEDSSVKKGILPSPRRDSAGRPAVLPPCPAPEPSAVDICDPLRYANMGQTPALQVSELTNDIAPNVRLEEAHTAAITQSPEANDEDSIEVMKTPTPRSFQLVQTAARAAESPPCPQGIPGSPEPIPHPASTSVTFNAPVATSRVYDMWQPRANAGSQSQDSLDNASLDVLGREDNTQDSFGSVCDESSVERVNVVGTTMEDGDCGSTLDVLQPLNNAAPLRGALGRDSTSVEPRAVIQTCQSSTDLVHLPEKSMGDASMEAQGKEACSTREMDGIEVVSRNHSLLDQSLRHRPPPARWSVYDLYEPLAGPSRPPNNSIDEASLEVQGRGVDGSREVSLADGVDVLPQNHSPLQRSLPRLSRENWADQSSSSREQQRRLDAPIGFREAAFGEHTPALATPVVASSSIPIRTGIPRASATIRRPLPRSPSVAVPPPAQVPPVDEVLEASGAAGLSQNHIQHIPCRVSTVGSAELGSSNPNGRRNIRAPVAPRSQVTEDTGACVVPIVVSTSLPVTSGIPRAFATTRRFFQPRSSVAPPLYPQPPPPPTIPAAPVTRCRVPTLPNAISSPRRANVTLTNPPTAPASITPAEASLPLSDGSFDNVLLVDGSLPPSTESSFADQWDQRLAEASLPGSIEDDSDIWAPTENAEAAWRLRESRPALKLLTASGFSLDIDLDTMNL